MKLATTLILSALLLAPVLRGSEFPRPSPDFAYTLPNGQTESLAKYKGKPVLLAFIDTTCSHCQRLTQILTGLQNEFGGKVQVIEVAFNEGASMALGAFIGTYKPNFPIGWAPRDKVFGYLQRSVMQRTFVPIIAFIDAKGQIRSQHYGGDPLYQGDEAGNIRKAIAELIKAR